MVRRARANPRRTLKVVLDEDRVGDPVYDLLAARGRGDLFSWAVEHPTDAAVARAWKASNDYLAMIELYARLYPREVHWRRRLVAQVARVLETSPSRAMSTKDREDLRILRSAALVEPTQAERADFLQELVDHRRYMSKRLYDTAMDAVELILYEEDEDPLYVYNTAGSLLGEARRSGLMSDRVARETVRRALPAPKLAEILGEPRRNPSRARPRAAKARR